MAYLFRQPKSRFWMAGFRDAHGRRANRSTKIEAHPAHPDPKERAKLANEARKKAQAVADTFERAARGELKRESDIRAALLSLVEAVGGPRIEALTLRQFLDKWVLDAEAARKSKGTVTRYAQAARDFLTFMAERADAPVDQLTPPDAQAYVNHLRAEGYAPKSIENTVKVLRSPFAAACRLGTLGLNPFAAVDYGNVTSAKRGTFTPGQIRLLLDACERFENGLEWAVAVRLGYYCGMRIGDATGLSWRAIRLDHEPPVIHFTPEKTKRRGESVTLPLHPELSAFLLALPAPDNPDAPLTPTLARAAGTRAKTSKAFARLMRAAGIENELADGQGDRKRKINALSFHALRHSLVSHLANAGVAAETRMKISAHSDARSHGTYTHLEIKSLAAALEKLPTA